MKKLIFTTLLLCIAFLLCACGADSESIETTHEATVTPAAEPAADVPQTQIVNISNDNYLDYYTLENIREDIIDKVGNVTGVKQIPTLVLKDEYSLSEDNSDSMVIISYSMQLEESYYDAAQIDIDYSDCTYVAQDGALKEQTVHQKQELKAEGLESIPLTEAEYVYMENAKTDYNANGVFSYSKIQEPNLNIIEVSGKLNLIPCT